MFEYTTQKVGERRKFRHLVIAFGWFKFVIFWMRDNLKIESTFNTWDKKKGGK